MLRKLARQALGTAATVGSRRIAQARNGGPVAGPPAQSCLPLSRRVPRIPAAAAILPVFRWAARCSQNDAFFGFDLKSSPRPGFVLQRIAHNGTLFWSVLRSIGP